MLTSIRHMAFRAYFNHFVSCQWEIHIFLLTNKSVVDMWSETYFWWNIVFKCQIIIELFCWQVWEGAVNVTACLLLTGVIELENLKVTLEVHLIYSQIETHIESCYLCAWDLQSFCHSSSKLDTLQIDVVIYCNDCLFKLTFIEDLTK